MKSWIDASGKLKKSNLIFYEGEVRIYKNRPQMFALKYKLTIKKITKVNLDAFLKSYKQMYFFFRKLLAIKFTSR